MGKSLSKRVFTMNLALSTLFRHDTSVQFCVFSVCIPSTIRLFTMKKRLVQYKFHGNERYSLRDHVLSVQLH